MSQHIIQPTHIRCIHQSKPSPFLQRLPTTKIKFITPRHNSTPMVLDHTTVRSDSKESNLLQHPRRSHNTVLIQAAPSTCRLQLKGITDPRLLFNNTALNNNMSLLQQPPVAGQANNWLKNDSDLVFLDLQHKKKSRRHAVLTRKPRSELLNDDHLRGLHDFTNSLICLGRKSLLDWLHGRRARVMLMSVFLPFSFCSPIWDR
jgi:hypothetical protein